MMVASSKRAGAATRWTRRPAALLVLCLSLCIFQAAAQRAVPPCAEVRPLYACSMQIADLPPFSGTPTPEMLAANTGISMGLQGLLSSDPDESCRELGSSFGGFSDEGSVPLASKVLQEPSGRHGRKQQRPRRSSQGPVMGQQHSAAATDGAQAAQQQQQAQHFPQLQQQPHQQQLNRPGSQTAVWQNQPGVPDVMLQGDLSTSAKSSVGPAARAYKYRIASLGVASAAAVNLTAAAVNLTAAAAAANSTNSSSSSSSSSNSSSMESEVWIHTPHGQRRQQQLAKPSRHLLAKAAASAEAAAVVEYDADESWLDGLFGSETEDAYDAKAAAYVEKQFCGKGTWMAGLSSSYQRMVTAAAVQGNASLVTTASLGSADDASVSISGHKFQKPHKQRKGQQLPDEFSQDFSTPEKSKPRKPRKGEQLSDAPLAPEQQPQQPRRRTGFNPIWGDDGLWMSESGVVPADSTVAVGSRNVVHIVNSLVKIMAIDQSRGVPDVAGGSSAPGVSAEAIIVTLPDFFGLVASSCDGGYITPSAAYDKQVGRFIVTAVCGGDSNQILLAVSQTSEATGRWWLYSFPAYVTYDTPTACTDGSSHFTPTSIHTQIGYNRDGVFISFVQNCPLCHVPRATGSVLYALPKWSLYTGSTQAVVGPVYTGVDVLGAVGQFNDRDFSAASFRQLQPVLPQRPLDVQPDVTYFVNDPISTSNPSQRKQLTTVALINTGSLWQYTCADDPAPVLVARVTGRGVDCSISNDTMLQQPQAQPVGTDYRQGGPGQCPPLDAGATRPIGFWSGGAAFFANQIYLTDRGPDLRPKSSRPYDSHSHMYPTAYWAVLSPSLCATGTCAAFMGEDWAYDEGWDWTRGAWMEHDMPKRARLRFFKLHPHIRAHKNGSIPNDPLSNFLSSLAAAAAPKPAHKADAATGRQLLQLAPEAPEGSTLGTMKAASDAMVSIAAVGTARKVSAPADQPSAQQQDASSAAAPAAKPKGSATAADSSSRGTSKGGKAAAGDVGAASSAAKPSSTRHIAARGTPGARRSPFLPQAAGKKRSFAQDSAEDGDSDEIYTEGYDDEYDDDSYNESANTESIGDDDNSDSEDADGSETGAKPRKAGKGSRKKRAKPAKGTSTTTSTSHHSTPPAAPTPAVPLLETDTEEADEQSLDSTEYEPLSLSADELDGLAGASRAVPALEPSPPSAPTAPTAPMDEPVPTPEPSAAKPYDKPPSNTTAKTEAVTQQYSWTMGASPPSQDKLAPLQAPAQPRPPPPVRQPSPPPAPRAAIRAPVPAPTPAGQQMATQPRNHPAPTKPRARKVPAQPNGRQVPTVQQTNPAPVSPRVTNRPNPVASHVDYGKDYGHSYDWSFDWPAPTAPRAPKPFRHPSMGDGQHHDNGHHPHSDYTYPHDDYPHPGPTPAPKGGKTDRTKPFPSKRDLATKTVWEIMLQAADHPQTSPVPQSHEEYYALWRDHPTVRRVYSKLNLTACYNPCKYHKNWYRDTTITFGVVVSRRGVIDAVTGSGENPIGLASPQVVVRDGSALVVYSYSGPQQVPGYGMLAFPGVGYSVIPPGQALGSPAFTLLQAGDGCIYQGPIEGREQQSWGSYSGADIHCKSNVAYTAVQYSTRPGNMQTQPSNAGTWLQAFAPAKFGWKRPNPHAKPPPTSYTMLPPAYGPDPLPYESGSGGSGDGSFPQPNYGGGDGYGLDPGYQGYSDGSGSGYSGGSRPWYSGGSSSGYNGGSGSGYSGGQPGYSGGQPGYGGGGGSGYSGDSGSGYAGPQYPDQYPAKDQYPQDSYSDPHYTPNPPPKPYPPTPPPKPYKPHPDPFEPYFGQPALAKPQPEKPQTYHGGLPDHIGGDSDDPPGGFDLPGPDLGSQDHSQLYQPYTGDDSGQGEGRSGDSGSQPYRPPPSYGGDSYSGGYNPPEPPTPQPYKSPYGGNSYDGGYNPYKPPTPKPYKPPYGDDWYSGGYSPPKPSPYGDDWYSGGYSPPKPSPTPSPKPSPSPPSPMPSPSPQPSPPPSPRPSPPYNPGSYGNGYGNGYHSYPGGGNGGYDAPLYLPIDDDNHNHNHPQDESPYDDDSPYEDGPSNDVSDGYGVPPELGGSGPGYGSGGSGTGDQGTWDAGNGGYGTGGYGTGGHGYGGSGTKPAPGGPKFVKNNPKQRADWINSHSPAGGDGGYEWEEEPLGDQSYGDDAPSYGSDAPPNGGYSYEGAGPAPYSGNSDGGYGSMLGKHDLHGGFVLAPSGHMNGGQYTNMGLHPGSGSGAPGQASTPGIDAGGSAPALAPAPVPASDAAGQTQPPVGAAVQRKAAQLTQQQHQAQMLLQQQRQQKQQLQKSQLAKQQLQMLNKQQQAVNFEQQQQQQPVQQQLVTSKAQPQKGMVLPSTELEGSDLSQTLAGLGAAASSSVQQLLQKLGLSAGDATPRQLAKAIKRVENAEKRIERHSSAVPGEPAKSGASLQYFDDYEVKDSTDSGSSAAAAASAKELMSYLQGRHGMHANALGSAQAVANATALAAKSA